MRRLGSIICVLATAVALAASPAGAGTAGLFTLKIKNGEAIRAIVTRCVNPSPSTLRLTAKTSDGNTTVKLRVRNGTGSVTVLGVTPFAGTVSKLTVSESGKIRGSGKGSPSGAPRRSFTIRASCP